MMIADSCISIEKRKNKFKMLSFNLLVVKVSRCVHVQHIYQMWQLFRRKTVPCHINVSLVACFTFFYILGCNLCASSHFIKKKNEKNKEKKGLLILYLCFDTPDYEILSRQLSFTSVKLFNCPHA